MFLSFAAIFITCFSFSDIISAQDYGNILNIHEGHSCPHPPGYIGTCRHVSRCLQAIHAVGKKESLKICSYRGLYPIVCCIEKSKTLLACEKYYSKLPKLITHTILNGSYAVRGEFPHMAALGYITPKEEGTEYLCAGTLISDRYVLTAAHCITDTLRMVRLGGLSLTSRNEGAVEFTIEKTYVHEKYLKGGFYNDIGLLRLSEKVKLKSNIYPACLLADDIIPEKNLAATGWGTTDPLGTKYTDTLKKTFLELVDLDQCNKTHHNSLLLRSGVTQDMFCIKDPEAWSDTCDGDSGGPAQFRSKKFDKIYTVAGVLSFGPRPCGGASPAVYTKVSSYLSWIEDIVWR